MDQDMPPRSWVGTWVELGLATRETFGKFGWLNTVSDLGITLQYPMRGGEPYEMFFPWAAVTFIRPRPESTPPER
jgi:hypothetical protein